MKQQTTRTTRKASWDAPYFDNSGNLRCGICDGYMSLFSLTAAESTYSCCSNCAAKKEIEEKRSGDV